MTVAAPMRLKNLIGGRFVDSAGQDDDPVLNPATEEILALCPQGAAADVEAAVQAAQGAAAEWGRSTPAHRATQLLALADALEEDAGELIRLECANVGKPMDAAAEELPLCADHLRFFAGAARLMEGKATGEYADGFTSMVRREPLGVVGQITPWNYPLAMAIWKIAPALAAGNAVVLKPSELTPLSTIRLAELAAEILPAGVLNVVTGRGAPVGEALVRHPAIAMVSLTGSVRTGKAIAAAAADHLARTHLELGGNAPVVVLDDADVEAAAEGIRLGAFFNAGQDCTAAARVIASSEIYDELVDKVVDGARSLKIGAPADDGVELGPVISARQRERVLGFVERARSDGAEIATGGHPSGDRGFFVEPTVVLDPAQDSEIVQNEVFGPVVTVQRADDAEQAIAWANDTVYGLAASIWTRGASPFLNAARELNFGCVWLNAHLPFLSEMPHGGYGQSGYGKDLSAYSLEEYTRIKHVMASLG
jgi:1-pyrroline dehydrogenase